MQQDTRVVWAGRSQTPYGGLVNTPVCRGSTILADSLEAWHALSQRQLADEFGAVTYGRFGTPTHRALEEAMMALEGGHRVALYPSGLAAIASVLMALTASGDEVLVPDSGYRPTRQFMDDTLARYGVQARYYDPCDLDDVAAQLGDRTRVVFAQSPGSDTFDIQDVPAIARLAHEAGASVVMDNTWATPLYFQPFAHGVDVSIHAATKYIVGHSDATLGIASCNEATWAAVRDTTHSLGQTASPDDVYLALRGLRTMAARLQQHHQSGLRVAQWLEKRPEVQSVLHPALPSHPGHALWRRDFTGACGLFGVVFKPMDDAVLARFVNQLRLFGIGLSWGGFESLVMPFSVHDRACGRWRFDGPALRLHVGLESADDLIADLAQAFDAIRSPVAVA